MHIDSEYLLVTAAPSFAVRVPSPSFKIFFKTPKSPVTFITGLKETSSRSILRIEHGRIEGKPFSESLTPSTKASAKILREKKILRMKRTV